MCLSHVRGSTLEDFVQNCQRVCVCVFGLYSIASLQNLEEESLLILAGGRRLTLLAASVDFHPSSFFLFLSLFFFAGAA